MSSLAGTAACRWHASGADWGGSRGRHPHSLFCALLSARKGVRCAPHAQEQNAFRNSRGIKTQRLSGETARRPWHSPEPPAPGEKASLPAAGCLSPQKHQISGASAHNDRKTAHNPVERERFGKSNDFYEKNFSFLLYSRIPYAIVMKRDCTRYALKREVAAKKRGISAEYVRF